MNWLKRRKWFLLAAAIVIVGAAVAVIVLIGDSDSSPRAADREEQTYVVARGDIENTLTVYGEVVPAQEYTFTFDGDAVEELSLIHI